MRGPQPAAHEWGKRAKRAALRGSTHEEEICEVGHAREARHGAAPTTKPRRGPGKTMRGALLAAVVLALAAGACGDDDGGGTDATPPDAAPDPLFPADYASTWTQVRDCRSSSSHDFHLIVIWADPDAAGPYLDRDADFPVGSVVLKEEYDIGDTECTGDIVQWSLMKRLEAGSAPEAQLDWLYIADTGNSRIRAVRLR